MQNLSQKKPHSPGTRVGTARIVSAVILFSLLLQIFSVCISATGLIPTPDSSAKDSSSSGTSQITGIDTDEITEQMRDEILASIKKNLLQKVETEALSGPVSVIITFSDHCLIRDYSDSTYSSSITYEQYRDTVDAKKRVSQMEENQKTILNDLLRAGLIDAVEHRYTHMLDGAFVTTTYEKLEELCAVAEVERVMLSNTYEAQNAVENPVDVYGTGIFNSSTISYTGKGTLVAILDTGCDYAHSAFTTYEVQGAKYDREFISEILSSTLAYGFSGGDLEAREVYYGNITGNKIVYGYDYADKDPDIMPYENSHGTHVAGIIAGKDTEITGVAIDAQLAIMKVFSDYGERGADEGDIIAALEDAIVLGVDAINMSLGSACGFSYESDPEKEYKNITYSRIEDVGISLVVAASNDHSSGYGGEGGNTNKTDNPDSATVGSPSSFGVSMTVASIDGKKSQYMYANSDQVVFFKPSVNASAKEYDFFDMLGIVKGQKVTYEYVTVPGLGLDANYIGLDVKGKIALVKRGDITFEEKVQYAQEAGAIGIIIYNNVYGDIIMTIGNHAKIPAVSIGRDDGEKLASVPSGTLEFDLGNEAGPFMSDFSSWGPTPDLHLKPDITAHGGNITSAVVGGEYDEMSGTSMAAPNMCGITVLIRQYVMEKYPEYSAVQVRDLVNQLCMSTATIALDKYGNPYSPRKQGAGIADIKKATTTKAYLSVKDQAKTKIELGDDPLRTGVYTFELLLNNISNSSVSYRIKDITMTESVSTSDPEYVAEIAYLLSNKAKYEVTGGDYQNGIVTVAAGATATVKVTLTLSAEDKSYLNSTFENGMFVEGYIVFENTNEAEADLNAPFLAFYGNWGDAPIFDLDYYEVETEAHNDAIDDEDKIKADYYATTPLGSYYYDYLLPLGTYLYEMDKELYTEIPATREHAAISYFDTSISGIYGVYAGLLRGAKEMTITMVDTTTGKVIWEAIDYNCPKAHYSGAPIPYASRFLVSTYDKEAMTLLGNNNAKIEVTMSAKLDWDGGENVNDTFSFSFYLDYEAPRVTEANYYHEYDKTKKENRYYLEVMIYDNHYAMSCRPIIIYDMDNNEYDNTKTYSSLTEYPIPIYQENRGEATKVKIEITEYIDIIKRSATPNGVTLYIDDYAMNSGVYYIPFPETDSDLDFVNGELTLQVHDTFNLNEYLADAATGELVTSDYFKTLKWTSSDSSVVAIKDGKIEALSEGYADIKVTSDSWLVFTSAGKDEYGREKYNSAPVYKTIRITVSGVRTEPNPESGLNASLEDLKFISYDTLYAHNSDINYSKIGRTGTTNFFDGNYSIEFYPAEQIRLNYELEPWNLASERYELIWSSSNTKVATVDENGVVTAQAKGKARITLQIKFGDKVSLIASRLSVEVKSEFIVENRKLVAYKGKGGDVVIPDDEGILYIGSYAFSHFILDNKKEVEKDEDGYYNLDDKKTPIGLKGITSVTIPEGVETIEKYAFYNCRDLKEVKLPDGCKNIGTRAFYNCTKLESINLDDAKIISDEAFRYCSKLTNVGSNKLSKIYTVGDYAFAGTAVNDLNLSILSRVGVGAFANCSKLTTVELGRRTRVSEKMFAGSALAKITVYGDIIQDKAFSGCSSLTEVVIKNNVTYLGKGAFENCSILSTVTANGEIELIGSEAFLKCYALKQLTLPAGEVQIGDEAFKLSGVNKITLAPTTVIKSIGASAFNRNNTLTVELNEGYINVDGVIYSADKTELVMVLPSASLTEITVPKSVEHIVGGAFSNLSTLKTVKFEAGSALRSIGSSAFADSTNLTTVELPQGSVDIGDYAFEGASSLKNISLSTVKSIGAYAFAGTAITAADLRTERVIIGEYAFSSCKSLGTVNIGAGATISAHAFEGSAVTSVTLGGDVFDKDEGGNDVLKYATTIGAAAFKNCTSLESFGFANFSGTISDEAFRGCSALTAIVAPKATAIGNKAFYDCISVKTLSCESLVSIGDEAFACTNFENGANQITTLDLPSLKEIGARAFYGSVRLTSVNMPNVVKLGEGAFSNCHYLRTATFSDKLTVIPEKAFEACLSLTDFDYTNIEYIGMGAFYLVPFDENLVLPNVTYIDYMAFVEDQYHFLKTLTAPKLTFIGEQAFIGCTMLESIDAPMVESIGNLAFAFTAITEYKIGENLTEIGYDIFESNSNFEAFYAIVDGVAVYDAEFEGAMIKDGVLYSKDYRGYTLKCYPIAKSDPQFAVAENTVRIEAYAFMDNDHLMSVTLPASLKYIGDYAFYNCDSLDTVVFKSYYAPVLEGSLMGTLPEINVDTVEDIPGFDLLYKYDYEFVIEGRLYYSLLYRQFKDAVGTLNAQGIVAQIPNNNSGYDSLVYRAFFEFSEETSGPTMGKYAIAFVDAVAKLPENIDRFDKLLMDNAIVAFNALEKRADEKLYVDSSVFERFEALRSAYNANVTYGKIRAIFELYKDEYSFNSVKAARASYLALTEEERELVSNAAILEAKIEELSEVFGCEIDFDLEFADHITDDGGDEPVPGGTNAVTIIIIVASAVVLLAAVAVVVIIFLKKKKTAAPVAEQASANSEGGEIND